MTITKQKSSNGILPPEHPNLTYFCWNTYLEFMFFLPPTYQIPANLACTQRNETLDFPLYRITNDWSIREMCESTYKILPRNCQFNGDETSEVLLFCIANDGKKRRMLSSA